MNYLKVQNLAKQGEELNELYRQFGVITEKFEIILFNYLSGYQEGDGEIEDLKEASNKIEELFMMALQSTQIEIEMESKL